jgi:hypothetical protein
VEYVVYILKGLFEHYLFLFLSICKVIILVERWQKMALLVLLKGWLVGGAKPNVLECVLAFFAWPTTAVCLKTGF